ncbi:MAG TPA: hypothetical protein VJJ79_02390 [Candidatus Nanoarchaeia archaeon]|nr:hypothetical protein [Candidatus Nanoarchaeia archaeon]
MKTNFFLVVLFFICALVPIASAQVAINSFTVEPEQVNPGETVKLKIIVENVGDDDVKDILVAIDIADLPFAPLDSSTEKIIEKIHDGDAESMSFELKVLPTAAPQVYKIPITISYNGTTTESLVSIEVSADTEIDLMLESSELTTVNTHGKVIIKFVNKGLTSVTFLKATVDESYSYDIISPAAVYIGDIKSGDIETEEFTILPTSSDPTLSLLIEYKDADNNLVQERKTLDLTVYTEEEAQQLGLIPSQVSLWRVLEVAVILVLAVVIYRKMKRRKNVA